MKLCAFADEVSPLIEKQIAALNRNAISLLEIRGVGEKNIKDVTPTEAKEIKKRLDEAGISVWSIAKYRLTTICTLTLTILKEYLKARKYSAQIT